MSERISDERLAELPRECSLNAVCDEFERDMLSVIDEAIASRTLVTELRALVERMRKSIPPNHPEHSHFQHGKSFATGTWVASLDSLLSAHKNEAKS